MQGFVIMLLACSATMSVLGLIYAALTPLLARRYSAKSRYYTWLIIVIGLIIPFRPSFGGAIVNYELPSETAAPMVGQSNFITIAAPSDMPTLPAAAPSVSLWQIAALIWLAGMIAFIAYHAIKHYRFTRMAAHWSENIVCEQTLSILEGINSEMGMVRKIGLYRCTSVGSPMLLGIVNPRILLPLVNSTPDELKFILRHELIHYKRSDLLYKCAVLLAAAIHWFNPIVYFLVNAIDAACELSCDAETVRDADTTTRQQYGETIIGVVRYHARLKTELSTNFYGGKHGMKKRIYSIMDTGKKKTGAAILCCVFIMTLGTGMTFAASANAKNIPVADNTLTVSEADQSMMSYFGVNTGETWTLPAIEWWTYDGYKTWMNEQIRGLQALADDGIADYYDKNGILQELTQADVDGAATLYQSILEDIKNGHMVSKTVDGLNDSAISYNPQDIALGVAETYVINSSNESVTTEYDYSKYASYGLTYDKATRKLYYKGELVRYFEDSYPLGKGMTSYISYFEKDGTIDVHAVRDLTQITRNADGSYDPSGILTGVAPYSQEEFNARDIKALMSASADAIASDSQGMSFEQIFEKYIAYGITFDPNSINGGLGNVYYNKKLVKAFVDVRPNGSVTSFSSSDGGDITVHTVYGEKGELIGLEVIGAAALSS